MGGMKRGRHVLRAERGKDNATEKKKVSMHSHVVCVCVMHMSDRLIVCTPCCCSPVFVFSPCLFIFLLDSFFGG
jgi:hypothetical protein